MSKKTLTLAAKLCRIMKAVDHVAKRGHNDLDDYNYATEGDVKEAFRDELAKRNVFLLPRVMETRRIPITLSLRGGAVESFITEQRVEYTFYDGDSAAIITAVVEGSGEDQSDKGVYKAMTGSLKSLLLTGFLLRSGDDPDASQQNGAVGKEVRESKKEAAQRVANEKLTGDPEWSALFYTYPEEANGHFISVQHIDALKEPLSFHGKYISKTGTYRVPTERLEDLRFTLENNYKCKLKELKADA